jgi:hypothetical protein
MKSLMTVVCVKYSMGLHYSAVKWAMNIVRCCNGVETALCKSSLLALRFDTTS